MTPLEKMTKFLAQVLFFYRPIFGSDLPTPNVNDGMSLDRPEVARITMVDAHWRFPGEWELLLSYDMESDSFAFYGDQLGRSARLERKESARKITWGDATPQSVALAIAMLKD